MKRRFFVAASTLAASAATLRAHAPAIGQGVSELIDTNVSLPPWPTRRTWAETPAALVRKLRQHGVTSAWAGSFEGVLHTDIAGVNARLTEICAREAEGVLRPFGTINPTLPDWEEDLRRCHEVHRMPGVRLFPNYHGYALDDPLFARLLDLAAQRGLLVQVALALEDDRSQNPVLAAAPVQVAPLPDVLAKIPRARVMLLNAGSRVFGAGPLLQRLAAAGVRLEIATLEGVAGISALWKKAPDLRLAFGSHSPYFYLESALLKLQESALTAAQQEAIAHGNARRALSPG